MSQASKHNGRAPVEKQYRYWVRYSGAHGLDGEIEVTRPKPITCWQDVCDLRQCVGDRCNAIHVLIDNWILLGTARI